ncbi:hypothetical protein ACFVTE_23255 [Arthrobacter sp. NPDC058097]|uniref:hypothetical protein n=1 Tax=Arthrobacter sp. NPDC058097 TaxID=3346340 RepID=UPI0036DA7B8F
MPTCAGAARVSTEVPGSVSAPVFDHTGRLAGVLGLGFPTQRVTPADAPRLGPIVARAAAAASSALAHQDANA